MSYPDGPVGIPSASALAVAEAGAVPGPPPAGWDETSHVIAMHTTSRAVAVLTVGRSSSTARWFTTAIVFDRRDGGHLLPAEEYFDVAGNEPFCRPVVPSNSLLDWVDWPATGPKVTIESPGEEIRRRTFVGFVVPSVERLTVTIGDGRTRDVPITHYNGAFIAVADDHSFELNAYDKDGRRIGRKEVIA